MFASFKFNREDSILELEARKMISAFNNGDMIYRKSSLATKTNNDDSLELLRKIYKYLIISHIDIIPFPNLVITLLSLYILIIFDGLQPLYNDFSPMEYSLGFHNNKL